MTNAVDVDRLPDSMDHAFVGWQLTNVRWSRELPRELFLDRCAESLATCTVINHVCGTKERDEGKKSRRSGTLEIGSSIDKYRIDEVLGHGAFATVYRARHLILQKDVALKVLHRHLLEKDPRFVDLLCDESRHTAQLDHANVVRVFDVTRTQSITYIVLEWVDGETLSKRVRGGGVLSSEHAVAVALDLCDGLNAALERGLIHRDVKPSNVLLHKGGAKIIDLGLARQELSKHSTLGRGAVVGTPGYMAPEQAIAAPDADFRVDVYSMGATLYFALAGQLPFKVKTVEDVRRLSSMERPRPLTKCVPSIHVGLARLVHSMLSHSPSARPGSYDEIREALLDLQVELGDRRTRVTR